jgi:hypothetical protein
MKEERGAPDFILPEKLPPEASDLYWMRHRFGIFAPTRTKGGP